MVGQGHSVVVECSIIILGLIVSVCWHLSNKGYYFWELHWVFFVLDLEQKMSDDKKIYSLFYQKGKKDNENPVLNDGQYFRPWKPANISTSKVTLVLSFIVSLTWSFLLCERVYKYVITVNKISLTCSCKWVWLVICLLISVGLIYLLILIGSYIKSPLDHTIKMFDPENKKN
ncbi:MAG: hypothetical protein MJ009_06155 [Paludibacteraceae bacterium]|nr:hypothetical protein [Paludibacteraceae bacterium]